MLELRVVPDLYPEAPELNDVEIVQLNSSQYSLGTKRVSREEMDEIRDKIASGKLIGVPVYAYIHSGVAISTSPFSCPWDSGQFGFAYSTKPIRTCKGRNKEAARKMTLGIIAGDVALWGKYISGDVWSYEIVDKDEDGDEELVNSCSGYYHEKDAREDGTAELESLQKQQPAYVDPQQHSRQ